MCCGSGYSSATNLCGATTAATSMFRVDPADIASLRCSQCVCLIQFPLSIPQYTMREVVWSPCQRVLQCCSHLHAATCLSMAHMPSSHRHCCCREKVGELLSQVCSGVGAEEMTAALQGLLAAAAHVRAAAIAAMLDVPAFAEGAHLAPLSTLCLHTLISGLSDTL